MAILKSDKRPNPILHDSLLRLVAGYRIINGGSSSNAVKQLLIKARDNNGITPQQLQTYYNAADGK